MKVEAYRGSAVEQLLFVVSLPLVDSAWVVSTYTHYRHSLISPTLLICLSRFPPQARLVSHHRWSASITINNSSLWSQWQRERDRDSKERWMEECMRLWRIIRPQLSHSLQHDVSIHLSPHNSFNCPLASLCPRSILLCSAIYYLLRMHFNGHDVKGCPTKDLGWGAVIKNKTNPALL